MKKLITAATLLISGAWVHALDLPIEAGKTNELVHGQFIYAKYVVGTNLQEVSYISQAAPRDDKRTVNAERADVEIEESGLLIIHLRNLELVDERRDGTSQRINAKHYPVTIDIRMMKRFQRDYGSRTDWSLPAAGTPETNP